MSAYRNNDPNEWADKRRAAMERAKQIREERKNASAEGATFQPQTDPLPLLLSLSVRLTYAMRRSRMLLPSARTRSAI